jgi:hypothetical protein
MANSSEPSTPRRDFLGQIAVSAMALAGAACVAPIAASQSAPVPTPEGGTASQATRWDDSWFGRLTARHKAVFDSPDIEENSTSGVSQATRYINGMREALNAGPKDVQTVVVIRHKSVPFAFNDAMWEKYGIGEQSKVRIGEAWATRNSLARGRVGGRGGRGGDSAGAAPADRPQSSIEWLVANGHVVLACDLATQGYAGQLATKTKGTMKAIYEELKANLVPGVILQPSGVYAVHRAQEAGCTFIRS